MATPSMSVTQKELFQAAQQNDFAAVGDYLQVLLHDAVDGSGQLIPPRRAVKALCEAKTKNTLLHYACDNGNVEACKFLLMCDGMGEAFLNEPNAFGHTPLFYAASSGKLPLVKWLISNGADIDVDYSDRGDVIPRDGDQGIFTPLQIACFNGHEDVVNFLVECNAALSGTRRNGRTPLHFACSQNHKAIIKILIEAGADAHACDDQGRTPIDLSHASLLPMLLPDEHGADEVANDGDGLETGRAEDEDDSHDGFSDADDRREALESIRLAFGNDIARDFRNKSWKIRVSAINDASNSVQNGANGKSLAKQFDGACQMILLSLQDAVTQVVSNCCTALLKTAFTAGMGISNFHSPRFHQERPVINRIAEVLLIRGSGSNEKDASEAVASLLFLICKSAEITQYLTQRISQIMSTSGSGSVLTNAGTGTPGKASSDQASGSVSWRLQLVAIKILNTIVGQYRLDVNSSGINFTDAVSISTSSLENASVHVRTAAIDLLVQCLLIRCEQSELSGSADEIFEQIKSWSEAVFKQRNMTLKPSIQAKINNGLKSALQKSKRLNVTTPRAKHDDGHITSERKTQNPIPLELAVPATSPRSKSAQKEEDLPYAEPIQEHNRDDAESIQECFGERITRCLFSNAWAPRVEALSLLQFQIQSKCIKFDGEGSIQLLQATQKTLILALQDRVNSVYDAGVSLLMEFAIAVNNSLTAISDRSVAQELVHPLIPRLLAKLGDTKARLHVTTEDALLLLSRQSNSLGPEFLLDEMVAADRSTSQQSLSPTYLTNKLGIVSKLLLEFGVKESTDGNGRLPIKQVLQPVLQLFEHRDPNVRQMALQIVADTLQLARAAAMPYIDALARASRQKIISKLVEKGVLEADLLMEEVDDFEITAEPVRPGTSSAVRPPTASGSSTKHRPALSNASLSSGVSSATSVSSQAQAPALPYGTALTNEQRVSHASIINCFGEDLVRCLLDKAWAQREAAVREIERLVLCTANGKLSADKALPKTIDTLRILGQCVELGLNDTVARVFQCTLRVCQIVATEFVPLVSSNSNYVDDYLERAVSAALQKFADTKQRLRLDCFTLLNSLASLPHIGQARMCRILCVKYQELAKASTSVASSPLVGAELFKLFTILIREGFASQTMNNRPELPPILSLMLPAFENKHVDVRNAAVDAYTAIYEATNGGADTRGLDLQSFLAQVKPAIRDTITRNILQISKNLPGAQMDDPASSRSLDSSRQQPLALDINKLRHVCSQDITDLLTSTTASQRCLGVDKMIVHFADSPRNPHFKGSWEISCLLAKQLLLDGTPSVCIAAFQLLQLIIDPPSTNPEYAIPWGEWGVHLILGSTIRSVVQQSANASIRVRNNVKSLLQLVASKGSAGKNAVCNALLSAPEQKDISNEPSKSARKIALCRLRWQMMLRLELILELIGETTKIVPQQGSGPPSVARRKSSSSTPKSTGDALSIENVVPFLGSCAVHPSPIIRNVSRKIVVTIRSTRSDEIQRFIQEECSSSLQRRLQPLLVDEDSDDNNHADHFNAEDATVVRGSRASHVRRVAALRPPRSVPVEEKAMAVDVFPPPHSAPGKSRRSLHQDDEDEFGDYVVKSRHRDETQSTPQQQQQQQSVPIWLDQGSRKSSTNPQSYSDGPKRDFGDTPEASLAVGGGAANLVKVRRKSSLRSNNGDDDDFAIPARTPGKYSSGAH